MTDVGPLADVEIIGTVPPIPSAEVLVLMAGIVMLVKWAGTLTKAPATIDLSDALPKAWSPTIELAKEATAQLRSRGSSRMITMTEKYRELHIQNRAATWHMENWYRPIRIWYNDDAAGADYRDDLGADAVVLEVGLLNYEWHGKRFVVQPMMRLIDAATGRVIGRTRHWAYPEIGRAAELLARDSARLKAEFAKIARPLVRRD